MDTHDTRSNPTLVRVLSHPEDGTCGPHDHKPYATATDHQEHAVEATRPSDHPDTEKRRQKSVALKLTDIQRMEPPQNKLQFFSIVEPKNVGVARITEAFLQGIERTLADAFKPRLRFTDTGTKSAFNYFLQLAQVEMIHLGILPFKLTKCFDRLHRSDALVRALGGEHWRMVPALTSHPGQRNEWRWNLLEYKRLSQCCRW